MSAGGRTFMLQVAQARQLITRWVVRNEAAGGGARPMSQSGAGSSSAGQTAHQRFWQWTTKERPAPARFSGAWWKEWGYRCCVFAVTGSSSLIIMRPALRKLLNEPDASLKNGPWTYRLLSVVLLSPVYAAMLCFYGTLAGRHLYFAGMATKIWSRLLPPALSRRMLCTPARLKRQERDALKQAQDKTK